LKNNKKLSFIERIVLAILEDSKRGTLNTNQVHRNIPIDADINKDQIFHALLSLTQKRRIVQPSKGHFQYISPETEEVYKLISTYSGDKLLKNESGEIIRAPKEWLRNFLPDDFVNVSYRTKGKRKEIIDIVLKKRTPKLIIGELDIFNGNAFLLTEEPGYPDIKIQDNLTDDLDGLKASVEIVEFKLKQRHPLGKLVEILGKPGDHNTEMHAIVAEFGFKTKFPKSVIQETATFPETPSKKEISSRKDFREKTTFTIDPEDAKDFDDALSIEFDEDSNRFFIGVHIADVEHYIKSESELDKEAFQRATSVYLVDRTIPMLPERLSNDLCSLKPDVDRLCFSVEFEIDADSFEIKKYWIGKGIIHSDKRFSYEEAQECINDVTHIYHHELGYLNKIAKKYENARFQNGALRFESKEIRFQLDEQLLPTEVIEKQRLDTHKLIETFMLLANQTIAKYVFNLKKPTPAFIYRSHDEPPMDKLLEFAKFCKLMGYPIQIDNEKLMRNSFNQLASKTKGKPEEEIIQQMSIRTMAKAIYTGKKTSHFGLAFQYYTHFTSPIRRYPDLLAHRILLRLLNDQKPGYSEDEIEIISQHSSNMEQKAADAERASIKYKLAELLKNHEGEIHDAKITGITEWGIYANILDFHAEGMIRISEIKFDQFYFVDDKRIVIGKRTKRKYQLGDLITVRIKRALPSKRSIDLTLLKD